MRHTIATAAVLALAALAPVSGPASAQAVGETIDVQGWKLHLDRNDDGTHTCAAMWRYEDKSAVGFAADTGNHTFLVISEPDAELKKNQKYQVKYKVDKSKQKTAMGIATSSTMLVVPIEDPDTDFAAFGNAETLYASFGGDDYEEPLESTKDAIRALGRCIANAPAT
jgi:phosphopantothenoylcysteine synthetase/decarboxylase